MALQAKIDEINNFPREFWKSRHLASSAKVLELEATIKELNKQIVSQEELVVTLRAANTRIEQLNKQIAGSYWYQQYVECHKRMNEIEAKNGDLVHREVALQKQITQLSNMVDFYRGAK